MRKTGRELLIIKNYEKKRDPISKSTEDSERAIFEECTAQVT
ncbi:hypothetical protein ACSAZL_21860 [Methanosarcina sp. T3]